MESDCLVVENKYAQRLSMEVSLVALSLNIIRIY